jgi:hypothetical protein
MLRLVGQIATMEQAEREEKEAQAREQAVHEGVNAHLARSAKPDARPQAPRTGTPADPPLYSPVNSQIQRPETGSGGENGVSPAAVARETQAPPLPQAA